MRLNEEQDKRLDSWLRRLETDKMVIIYDPETDDGFRRLCSCSGRPVGAALGPASR